MRTNTSLRKTDKPHSISTRQRSSREVQQSPGASPCEGRCHFGLLTCEFLLILGPFPCDVPHSFGGQFRFESNEGHEDREMTFFRNTFHCVACRKSLKASQALAGSRLAASTTFRRRPASLKIIVAAWIGAFVAWVGTPSISQAQTSITAQTAASSISSSQLLSASRTEVAGDERLAWSLKKFPPQPHMRELYWQFAGNTPAFFHDSLLQFVARSYFLTRDNFDGSKSQAWAFGGWIAYRSGLIADVFGVHAAFYTSQKLFAPLDEGGTGLLASGQNTLGMLGQIYGRVQIVDQELRAGRQLVNTPLINADDSRMVPNTFGGTALVTLPDQNRNYDYAVGYLWSVKQRDSNDFISMSDALAGTNVVNRGATFGGVRYRPFSGLSLTVMDYYIQNFLNTGFAQVEYDLNRPKEVPNWIIGANIIDQRSVGADLLTGASFRTYQVSGKVQMVYVGWTLFIAGSVTGDDSNIYAPFGSNPNQHATAIVLQRR